MEIKRNRLNKDIKKENFEKDLINLIETNTTSTRPLIIVLQAVTRLKAF